MKRIFTLLSTEEIALALGSHVIRKRGLECDSIAELQMMIICEGETAIGPLAAIRIEIAYPETSPC